jgi:hypothetical protein
MNQENRIRSGNQISYTNIPLPKQDYKFKTSLGETN